MTTNDTAPKILDIIGHDTKLRWVANTRGGEYAGPCPFCGGKDRFHVQPEQNKWRCRQCSPTKHWHSVYDYIMQRDGVGFAEAKRRLHGSDPRPTPASEPEDPRTYPERHGCTWQDFNRWGAELTTFRVEGKTYDAIRFSMATGPRYRLFGHKDKFRPERAGFAPCWYGLAEAVDLAQTTGQDLVIVNGPPSVIACHAHGVAACTIPGGEGNVVGYLQRGLLDELREAWRGGIIVLLDGDAEGRKNAPKVAAVLREAGFAVSVKDAGTRMDAADVCRLHNGTSVAAVRSLPELEDAGDAQDEAPPPPPPSAQMAQALAALGYRFRLNLCDDTIEVNEKPIDDIVRAEIRTRAYDAQIRPRSLIDDVCVTEAAKHAYHPIRDYLEGLAWDGADHIGILAKHLICKDPPIVYPDGHTTPTHEAYLRRWLIGAVAKVFDQQQNLMLVLSGAQDIGKSAFARWLCSGIPDRFIEGPIKVDDKDSDVRLMTKFIWEVSELDATTRKADVSALKSFITRETVTVRRAYARYDSVKPATASMIGTINESTGFLSDETGNRRFLVTRIDAIDWAYTSLDADQVWAQAVALYRNGEPWRLLSCERAHQAQQNQSHEVESLLDGWLLKYFDCNAGPASLMTAADIADHLYKHDIRLNGNEISQSMAISRVLTRLGVRKVRTSAWRGYSGIAPRDTPLPTTVTASVTTCDNLENEVVTPNTAFQSPNDNVTTYDSLSGRSIKTLSPDAASPERSQKKDPPGESGVTAVIGCHLEQNTASGRGDDNLEEVVIPDTKVVTPKPRAVATDYDTDKERQIVEALAANKVSRAWLVAKSMRNRERREAQEQRIRGYEAAAAIQPVEEVQR